MDTSIFEVVGPKMMGPSSSATAGMARIGHVVYQFLSAPPKSIDLTFMPSREESYFAHATHLALIGGVLGLPEYDMRLRQSIDIARERGIKLTYSIFEEPLPRSPLSVGITVESTDGKTLKVLGTSVGGGSISIDEINGFKVNPASAEAHLFVWADRDAEKALEGIFLGCTVNRSEKDGKYLFYVSVPQDMPEKKKAEAEAISGVEKAVFLAPFVALGFVPHTPLFTSYAQLLKMSEETGKNIFQLTMDYEINRSGRTYDQIWAEMADYWEVMKEGARAGQEDEMIPLYGCNKGDNGKKIMAAYKNGVTLGGSILPKAIAIAVGMMEYSGSCHCVIATPTAGACGLIPGCMLPVQEVRGFSDTKIIESLFVAAAIGVVMYYHNVSFSGSSGGCQGEVGVGSAMTAAALCYVAGASSHVIIQGATLAMKHILGLLCDPIPASPEIPCIKRSGIGVANSFSGADMALSGVESFIPPDEVIDSLAFYQEKIDRGAIRQLKYSGENVGCAWTPTGKMQNARAKETLKNILLEKKK